MSDAADRDPDWSDPATAAAYGLAKANGEELKVGRGTWWDDGAFAVEGGAPRPYQETVLRIVDAIGGAG